MENERDLIVGDADHIRLPGQDSQLENRATIYAASRRNRISYTEGDVRRSQSCPFCFGAPEIQDTNPVRILKNRYPILSAEAPLKEVRQNRLSAFGYQDVFLYTQNHNLKLYDQTPKRIAQLFAAIGKAVAWYHHDDRIQFCFSMEVCGRMFGPSLEHSHGQTFAFPFHRPPSGAPASRGKCELCTVTAPCADGRILSAGEETVALVPERSRSPFEFWVAPHEHVDQLANMSDAAIMEMAVSTWRFLKAVRVTVGVDFAYTVSYFHGGRDDGDHFRIEVRPAVGVLGQTLYESPLEGAVHVYANAIEPEEACKRLQDASVL